MDKTKQPVQCNVYTDGNLGVVFHYPDTSLLFINDLHNLYVKDRDHLKFDVFHSGDFEKILLAYLKEEVYRQFLDDFGGKGFFLCSNTGTHSISVDELS